MAIAVGILARRRRRELNAKRTAAGHLETLSATRVLESLSPALGAGASPAARLDLEAARATDRPPPPVAAMSLRDIMKAALTLNVLTPRSEARASAATWIEGAMDAAEEQQSPSPRDAAAGAAPRPTSLPQPQPLPRPLPHSQATKAAGGFPQEGELPVGWRAEELDNVSRPTPSAEVYADDDPTPQWRRSSCAAPPSRSMASDDESLALYSDPTSTNASVATSRIEERLRRGRERRAAALAAAYAAGAAPAAADAAPMAAPAAARARWRRVSQAHSATSPGLRQIV